MSPEDAIRSKLSRDDLLSNDNFAEKSVGKEEAEKIKQKIDHEIDFMLSELNKINRGSKVLRSLRLKLLVNQYEDRLYKEETDKLKKEGVALGKDEKKEIDIYIKRSVDAFLSFANLVDVDFVETNNELGALKREITEKQVSSEKEMEMPQIWENLLNENKKMIKK